MLIYRKFVFLFRGGGFVIDNLRTNPVIETQTIYFYYERRKIIAC
ncbi:MAG: hypothetical protein Q8764_01985 [Pigeon pea little leaf phytoplasma]|nr:hypothetical protein [Pigeon pea little leaf phytoplasma]